MSDYSDGEEFEYQYSEEEDEGGSGDGGSDEELTPAIEVENTFYEADDIKNDDPAQALELFEKVLRLENEMEEKKWRFKALVHIVLAQFKLRNFEAMFTRYKELLADMDNVTRNERTDAINTVLETVSACNEDRILAQVYEVTLQTLKDSGNERLWFTTNKKLAQTYLATGDHKSLRRVIEELHRSCRLADGSDDAGKGSNLLEVYALQIQMFAKEKNSAALKRIYPKTEELNAAIKDPRIMSVIRELGGKMYMEEKQWMRAYNEFFEGFRNFQEAGNERAATCLKYVVLANMLALSDINPFDSREAKAFQERPEIKAMIELRRAYDSNDIHAFEKILNDPKSCLLDDTYLRGFLSDLVRNIRAQVLIKLVGPYRRVKLDFISGEINLTPQEVEALLVELILDGRVRGKIDQTRGFLDMGAASEKIAEKRYTALARWTDKLESLHVAMANQI